MPKQGQTTAEARRDLNREEIRLKLQAGGYIQYVIDSIDKLKALKPSQPDTPVAITQQKAVIDSYLKLINKYLPDLKSTEISGPGGGPIETDSEWRVEVHEVKPDA